MRKLQEIQAELRAKIEAQNAIITKAETEKRDFSEDEQTQFDTLRNEIANLEKELKQAEQIEEAKKRSAKLTGKKIDNPAEPEKKRFSIIEALRAAASNEPMPEHIQEVHQRGVEELRRSGGSFEGRGIVIPAELVRGISVTGDSGTKGGETIKTDVKLVDGLFPKLTVEEMGATVLTGLEGDLKLVAGNGISFDWVYENEDAPGTDAEFSGPTLSPKTMRGYVDISTRWLAQNSASAETYVRNLIKRAISKAFMEAVINGNGTKAPKGILNIAGVGVDTTATPSWDAVVKLESMIDSENATDKTRQYLMRPELKGKFKTTKKDAGSGIFIIEGKELNGYAYKSSTLVPVLATDKYPLIFGDWSQLTIGQWAGIKMLVDPFTQSTKGNVRVVIELLADVQLVNPKAFAVNKSLTLS